MGGVAAAPFAAWLVKVIPVNVLGIFVGGLIIFTNSNTLMKAFHVPGEVSGVVRIGVIAAWLVLLFVILRKEGRLPNFFQKKEPNKVGRVKQ